MLCSAARTHRPPFLDSVNSRSQYSNCVQGRFPGVCFVAGGETAAFCFASSSTSSFSKSSCPRSASTLSPIFFILHHVIHPCLHCLAEEDHCVVSVSASLETCAWFGQLGSLSPRLDALRNNASGDVKVNHWFTHTSLQAFDQCQARLGGRRGRSSRLPNVPRLIE